MEYRVVFHPKAEDELEKLYDYIEKRASPAIAWTFVSGIRDYCFGFSTFPERGTVWPEGSRAIRIVGYRRRVSIVFAVEQRQVMILGIFYGGQNIDLDLLEERF